MTIPRVATSDWCKDVVGIFYALTGEGVDFFHNEGLLKDVGVLEAVRTGVAAPPASWDRLAALPSPSAAGIASDQEQKQLAGVAGFQRLGLMFEQLYDPSHRDFLTWKHALAQCGYYLSYYNSFTVFNVAYGPWNSAMWYHTAVTLLNP